MFRLRQDPDRLSRRMMAIPVAISAQPAEQIRLLQVARDANRRDSRPRGQELLKPEAASRAFGCADLRSIPTGHCRKCCWARRNLIPLESWCRPSLDQSGKGTLKSECVERTGVVKQFWDDSVKAFTEHRKTSSMD